MEMERVLNKKMDIYTLNRFVYKIWKYEPCIINIIIFFFTS